METEWYETHFQNVLTKTRPCRKPVETTSPKKYIKTRKVIPVVCPQGLNQTCFREVALPQVRNTNQGFHSLECRVNPMVLTSGLASSPEIDRVWPTHINFTTPHKKEKRMVSFTKHSVWSVTMQLPCHNSCHWEISKCWLSHSKVGGHTTNPQIIFVPWCAKTVAGQLSPRTKTPCPFTTRKHSNHWVRSYFPGFFSRGGHLSQWYLSRLCLFLNAPECSVSHHIVSENNATQPLLSYIQKFNWSTIIKENSMEDSSPLHTFCFEKMRNDFLH